MHISEGVVRLSLHKNSSDYIKAESNNCFIIFIQNNSYFKTCQPRSIDIKFPSSFARFSIGKFSLAIIFQTPLAIRRAVFLLFLLFYFGYFFFSKSFYRSVLQL